MTQSKKIAVLKGGWSPEREVSLVSGAAAAMTLRGLGHEVFEIDATPDMASELIECNPDIVFNGLHGEWGEDGCVQGLLEILGLPYTHSGVLASSLAMDKQRTKELLKTIGLPVPAGYFVDSRPALEAIEISAPYVIKPNASGSSVNTHVIQEGDNRLPNQIVTDHKVIHNGILIEEFISGRELTVAVMGDTPLAVTEIIAHQEFYDYQSKYEDGGSSHVVPADLPPEVTQACLEMALKTHQLIGCKGLTRTDFRYTDKLGINGLFILEINTQPGLTPTSLAPEQAQARGIGFEELIAWMIGDASCRR